ncbi:unnamed protein product, partial [Ectocarpus sp. 13 AM-2016]
MRALHSEFKLAPLQNMFPPVRCERTPLQQCDSPGQSSIHVARKLQQYSRCCGGPFYHSACHSRRVHCWKIIPARITPLLGHLRHTGKLNPFPRRSHSPTSP